ASSNRSFFKNKKVDYDKLSTQVQDRIQEKKSILKEEDPRAEGRKKEAKRVLEAHLKDISQIHIPAELGRVIEVYNASSDEPRTTNHEPRLIVHIQDLHTNPEAELNLARILELLLKDYNLGLVCSEGADGIVDTSSVSSFPDYDVREKTARLFIDSGELTGEEYLSITKYPDLPIWGIEDKDIYFENIIQFNKIMKFSSSSRVFISQAKDALTALKPKVYSKGILAIDQNETDYEDQKIETDKYLEFLSSYITKFNIPTDEYKNIAILIEAQDMEKAIDQKNIMQESQNLLVNLQAAILKTAYRSELDLLSAQAQLFRDQKISPFSFYSYLKDLALRHLHDGIAKYPNLSGFVDYLTKVNSLDTTKLFVEMESLTYEVKQLLAKKEEEKTLTKALRNIKFLEGFFNLKISNEELDYYLENKETHKVAFFEGFLKPALKKYNISAFIDFNPDLIDFHLKTLEDFYKTVKQRDTAMLNNSLSEIEKRDVKVAALISGGFHTKGITRELRAKGCSYIVISPYSSTDIDEENYHFLLSGKRKPITELLKGLQDTLRVSLAFSSPDFKAFLEEAVASAGEVGIDISYTDSQERILEGVVTAAIRAWHRQGKTTAFIEQQLPLAFPGVDLSQIVSWERRHGAHEGIEIDKAIPEEKNGELSIREISEIMEQRGYPQLEKIWEEVVEEIAKVSSNVDVDKIEIDKEAMKRAENKYFATLRYRDIVTFLLTLALPVNIFVVLNFFLNLTDTPLDAYIFPINLLGVLSLCVSVYFDYEKVSDVKRRRLASFLLKENYRNWFDNQRDSQEVAERLRQVEVNELWDNPEYHRVYQINGEAIEEVVEVEDHISLTQKALRYFIGYRDESGKPHQGELTGNLKRGGKSAREILRKYSDIIELIKKDELTRDNSLYFLNELKTHYIKPGTRGEKIIDDFIEAIAETRYLIKGMVGVSIWQRDPWVDLSSHTEFNCCAFLGGINDLGVFGYMRNKSMSMLDFRTRDARIARVIMGAGIFTDEDGEDRGVLVIDSVEGTLSLDRNLIKQAIEDYASICGFSKVFYNYNVYNVVPKRFIKHVKEKGTTLEALDISFVDASSREYLETFSRLFFIAKAPRFLSGILNFFFPQIKFAYPRGRVRGYTVDLQPQPESLREIEPDIELSTVGQIDPERVSLERVSPGEWHNIREDIMEVEQVFHEDISSPEQDLREIFDAPTSITIVLRYDNRVIGYIAGGRLEDYGYIEGIKDDENYKKYNTAYIDSIAVLAEFQGHGLGHNLRQEFLRIAATKGYTFVTTHHKKGIASKRGDVVLAEFDDWYDTGEAYEYSRTHLGEPVRPEPLYQSGGITIERALPLDWDSMKHEIMSVEEVSFPESFRETEQELGASFTDPASVALIVRFQGEIIGYIVGGPLEDYKAIIKRSLLGLGRPNDINLGLRNSFYVESIAIVPEYRKHLIGIKLFKILHRIVRERGYTYITYHTIDERIVRLFIKLGAEIVFRDRFQGSYLRLPTILSQGISGDTPQMGKRAYVQDIDGVVVDDKITGAMHDGTKRFRALKRLLQIYKIDIEAWAQEQANQMSEEDRTNLVAALKAIGLTDTQIQAIAGKIILCEVPEE
ncbi:MAG: GNAT family N-acetyltransferase, partial [Candidatus Omnitrophica bacterium]|nr:GNAT family N-acetyltransferase [Candidatus Omnitrophota bacterium]